MFTDRSHPVMTGATTTQDLRVVDGKCWLPRRRRVAIFANNRRLNVRGAFAGRIDTVMTANAVADYVGVIENSRKPGRSSVAIVALVAG